MPSTPLTTPMASIRPDMVRNATRADFGCELGVVIDLVSS